MSYPDRVINLLYQQTSAGTGPNVPVSQVRGTQAIEVINTGTGTCQVVIENAISGDDWYPSRTTQEDVDPEGTSTSLAIAVAANSAHEYLLDIIGHTIHARVQNVTGSVSVSVRLDVTETL